MDRIPCTEYSENREKESNQFKIKGSQLIPNSHESYNISKSGNHKGLFKYIMMLFWALSDSPPPPPVMLKNSGCGDGRMSDTSSMRRRGAARAEIYLKASFIFYLGNMIVSYGLPLKGLKLSDHGHIEPQFFC